MLCPKHFGSEHRFHGRSLGGAEIQILDFKKENFQKKQNVGTVVNSFFFSVASGGHCRNCRILLVLRLIEYNNQKIKLHLN